MASPLLFPPQTLRPTLAKRKNPTFSSSSSSSARSSAYFRRYVSALMLPRQSCFGKSEGITAEGGEFPSSPLAHLVQDFYEHINRKDMKKLKGLLDSRCIFEDHAFPTPFVHKEAVLHFLSKLSAALGKNVRFKVDDVYGGGEEGKGSAGVRWHLEWNSRAIPLTKGCTFFNCSENDAGILIKKACVFVELPLKPGAILLELLGLVTSLFERYPKLAVWFLEKPGALLQILWKAYKLVGEPLLLPLLAYYTHVCPYGARLLAFALRFIIQLVLRPFT